MIRSSMIAIAAVSAALSIGPLAAATLAPDPEIEAAVHKLFDAMRRADGAEAEALFHPEARLLSVGEQNGVPTLGGASAVDFVRAIGTPRDQVWDERIANLEIRVDGRLATAWMDYAFYVDDRFSHCGVNAFQFFRSDAGWQIIQITDTRRAGDCGI